MNKKHQARINDDDELVTKSFLREEFDSFFHNRLEPIFTMLLQQFDLMNEEREEFRQQREELYRSDIRQEKNIDALDQRVLRLETSNK